MRIKKMYQGEIPENKIVGTYTESNTDAYNCSYVNNNLGKLIGSQTITDAGNGWKKIDLGFCRLYFKNGSTATISMGGNGFGYTPDIVLPTGLAFLDDKMIFSGQFNSGDAAITTGCRINPNGSYVYGCWHNRYSGTVNATLRYHFHIFDFR